MADDDDDDDDDVGDVDVEDDEDDEDDEDATSTTTCDDEDDEGAGGASRLNKALMRLNCSPSAASISVVATFSMVEMMFHTVRLTARPVTFFSVSK